MAKRPLAWTGTAPGDPPARIGSTWAGETPVRGGILRYAMIDTPPSLDAHILTAP